MTIPTIKSSSPPSRDVSLPRRVTATVLTKPDHDEVSFCAHGQGRQILLCALQDKPDFMRLVHRFSVRIVPCVDGQIYFLPASATDAFIAEVGHLVEDYIPEIPD